MSFACQLEHLGIRTATSGVGYAGHAVAQADDLHRLTGLELLGRVLESQWLRFTAKAKLSSSALFMVNRKTSALPAVADLGRAAKPHDVPQIVTGQRLGRRTSSSGRLAASSSSATICPPG